MGGSVMEFEAGEALLGSGGASLPVFTRNPQFCHALAVRPCAFDLTPLGFNVPIYQLGGIGVIVTIWCGREY